MQMRDLIRQNGYEAILLDMETRNTADWKEKLIGYDVIISAGEKFPAETFDFLAGSLKLVSRFGVGTDEMDHAAATRNGVAICNAAGTLSTAVAECVIGLMINILRELPARDRSVRNNDWSWFFEGKNSRQIEGKTVGLIGFGDIAKALAKMLYGFDCRVMAYDIRWDEDAAAKWHVEKADIPTIQREADIVSLHIPATSETCGMVNMDFLKAMKRDAILINTARGKLVVEEDLAKALQTGIIAAAGLDVFRQEPPESNNPLIHLPNVMVLPHSGAGTTECVTRAGICSANNAIDFLNGKTVVTILNPAYRGKCKE
ncbi:MAG: phosphoglycerate dehydrogenase [Clostridiaceae bacterium]|nr:phosphoglycerate dehydrogenase [Clostridiaceae bacterium]